MLAFVTSLRHPQNSADYGRVEALLKQTLDSVTKQTSDDYVVIVVGNRRPAFPLPPKVEFVEVGFPAPAPADGPRTARAPFIWDKGTKIGVGLLAAAQHAPDHVMIFDADDFVSSKLVEFIAANDPTDGWYVSDGWMYSSARGVFKKVSDFNRACGTSFVIPFGVYGVPGDLTVEASQEEIARGYGERLEAILGAHRGAVEWHKKQGRVLKSLPFRAAVYHVDTGENHSGKALTGLSVFPSRALRDEFHTPSSSGGARAAWYAFGPTAAFETVRGKLRARAARRETTPPSE